MTYGYFCTCGPYQSIVPPSPCPIHSRTWTTGQFRKPCTGRHCAHSAECGTYYTFNYTFGGLNG